MIFQKLNFDMLIVERKIAYLFNAAVFVRHGIMNLFTLLLFVGLP